MIITDSFVFIHMHKTGGQTLNDIIKRCIPHNRVIGYHYPRGEIPAEFAKLPVVGLVRNPWDWYVSWYAFNRMPKIRNQLFNVVSDSGQGNFKSTISNLINLGSDSSESKLYRKDLIRMLPDSLEGNRAAGLTKASIRNFSTNETGYYSWLTGHMLGNAHDDQTFIGHFENLHDDFLDIMKRLSVKETETLRTDLDKHERKNVSRHSHYSHYYDDELRDLVASKEQGLIVKFDYEFKSMKPAGVVYDFSPELYASANKGFRKLLGRESNFLKLRDEFDVAALKNKIDQIPADKWLESERERLFAVHKDTQSLLVVLFEDFKHKKPDYLDLYFELQNELKPVIDYIAGYYENNGFIVRVLLAKLLAGGKIPHHTDAGFSLLNCHRVHLPIITNDEVDFVVGGEEINMQVGEFWEINNGLDHAVKNRSDQDRIHIIIDWMPNYAGKSEEEVLTSGQPEGTDTGMPSPETMDAMIAQAYQVHQSGQAARAESLYRQVLHIDAGHVVANNLLGLLCLQTKRFDEAVYFIEKALAKKPDDAQAHSNMGLALKDLNRPEDAARHFHESLKLEPNNPKVYNNLGSIYMLLRRVDDAIRCFQQALAIQPASAEVHHNLGSAMLVLQRYTEAVASLQQCLALKPDFAAGRIKLEQAQQALRNQESAPISHD